MKYSELPKSIRELATWEDNLKERQESLSGVPSEDCLVDSSPLSWPRRLTKARLVVASMCLAEHDCEACLKMLRTL